ILRRKSSEYARAIVGLQENFQSTTILSHSTLIPAYIIIPIVTRNGLARWTRDGVYSHPWNQ
ncbi:MAG TPA: hypothetical protein VFK06_19145, partial [Candidatus Angelobacter sp.]|nr:hypothetical protein [Candidatus Angelobacter sp.]